MKASRYKLLVGASEDLENDVNKLIREGWQPLAGPVVCSHDRPYELAQAMVRWED